MMDTDLMSYPIEGWLPSFGYLSIPLISHITGNLWTGGCRHGAQLDHDFSTVVSLYPREQYALGPNTERIEIRMRDVNTLPDRDDLDRAVQAVLTGLERGKTLVHCQAGLNRSGMVAALALIQLGYTPEDAVSLLRKQRSDAVLTNSRFAHYVLTGE